MRQRIHTIGDPNVVMVMRGFVGGIKDWRKTTEFSSQVLARDPFCNIPNSSMRNVLCKS